MLDENKVLKGASKPSVDDCLMKPFALGWTREVVNRVITNNRNPNCDIYYISPNGKKIRSLTEIKSNLTDGLTPECFSFKKQPLGVNENYETVRNARVKRKESILCNGKTQTGIKKSVSPKSEPTGLKRRKLNSLPTKNKQSTDESNAENNVEPKLTSNTKGAENEDQEKKEIESKKSGKNATKQSKMDKSLQKSKRRTSDIVRRPESARRKAVLKKSMIAAKQEKQKKERGGIMKMQKKIINKKGSPKVNKLSSAKSNQETGKVQKGRVALTSKEDKKPLKRQQTKSNKEECTENAEISESDKKSGSRDLRSIVKKNIGKYREMREQQKLAIKSQIRMRKNRVVMKNFKRTRSEPISKNKQLYLKPLEKGWRRELVFRANCARAGQHADVYYFHPNGKKLRSCREISENLTHGLTIEYFTFRKEPIGCGEPSEVVRNARSNFKQT